MVYPEITDVNMSNGIQGLFTYAGSAVPAFIPLTLFAFFVIILLATYFSQRRFDGRGDLPASFTVAGFATAVLCTVFSLYDGLVDIMVLSITYGVAVMGVLWLLSTRD